MKNLIQKIQKFKKVTIWLLLLVNLVLGGGYTYAVNRTVFNVVATNKAEKALVAGYASVADLESEYISLSNKLTLDFAYARGYQDASLHQIYVPSKTTLSSLSFNVR